MYICTRHSRDKTVNLPWVYSWENFYSCIENFLILVLMGFHHEIHGKHLQFKESILPLEYFALYSKYGS